MNWLSVDRSVRQRGLTLFSPQDLRHLLGASETSVRFLLTRAGKRGDVLKLRRELYTLPDRPASDMEIANRLYRPSYISFEYALAYAKDRVQFGVPIAQKQAVAFMLAEMATEIDATRMLVWEAAWTLDKGLDATHAAALAKTGADDTTMMVTDRGVQILGGHGYIREHPVELWMRNGRGFPMFTGMAMV